MYNILFNRLTSTRLSVELTHFIFQENSGQHNLSIALRHILQQIVDSTNPMGHKNTDMALPHDGYTQKLSWFFECDKCQYKAFYSNEMENHKRSCYYCGEFKFQTKKRKITAPKRVSSTTHPPHEGMEHGHATHPNKMTSLFSLVCGLIWGICASSFCFVESSF